MVLIQRPVSLILIVAVVAVLELPRLVRYGVNRSRPVCPGGFDQVKNTLVQGL